MNVIHKLDRVIDRATTVIAVFSFAATLFMMAFISVDVFGRLLFKNSINGCYEIVEAAMGLCVFASLAYTQAKKGHVHVTMVLTRMPGRARLLCYAVTSLITTGVIAAVGYATARQAMLSAASNQITGVLKMPYSMFYGVESFCMWAFFVVLLYDTVKNFIAIAYAPLSEEIQSHWS